MEQGGWYPDPEGESGLVRWWDGTGWTEHTVRAGSAAAKQPPPGPQPTWWQRLRRAPQPQQPVLAAAHLDWRSRPAPAAPPPAPYDDPAAGIYNAPYEEPAAAQPEPQRAEPFEDPAAGIYAARLDEPKRVENPTDIIESGAPAGRRSDFFRTPAFGFASIVVLIVGVVVAGMVLSGGSTKPVEDNSQAFTEPTPSPDNRPPLEQMCANTAPSKADPKAPIPPAPAGPRISDVLAHISYAAQGPPFRLWNLGPWGNVGGGLGEVFTTGQYFVTQADTPDNSPYMATILSGTVPATYGDDPHPNIECAARVIGDDVRRSYYPQPNSRRSITAKPMTISGRPAYFLEFHLSFDEPGFDAKGELVAICVIDVPGNRAAALYISIPDTHKQYDKIITPLINSVRVG